MSSHRPSLEPTSERKFKFSFENFGTVFTRAPPSIGEECGICLERLYNYDQGNLLRPVISVHCQHQFHVDCLKKWVDTSDQPRCPLCKAALSQNDVFEASGGDSGYLNYILDLPVTDETIRAAVALVCERGPPYYHPIHGRIANWDTRSVTSTARLFYQQSYFRGDLSNWAMHNVQDMSFMFAGASAFNSDISRWNLRSVENMKFLFAGAEEFNGDISEWNLPRVQMMERMFASASNFRSDLSKWNTSLVIDLSVVFDGCSDYMWRLRDHLGSEALKPLTDSTIKAAVDLVVPLGPPYLHALHGPIANWDVSQVTKMLYLFSGHDRFIGEISRWDVRQVADFGGMFIGASAFNTDLSFWEVSPKSITQDMFYQAISYKPVFALGSRKEAYAVQSTSETVLIQEMEE